MDHRYCRQGEPFPLTHSFISCDVLVVCVLRRNGTRTVFLMTSRTLPHLLSMYNCMALGTAVVQNNYDYQLWLLESAGSLRLVIFIRLVFTENIHNDDNL